MAPPRARALAEEATTAADRAVMPMIDAGVATVAVAVGDAEAEGAGPWDREAVLQPGLQDPLMPAAVDTGIREPRAKRAILGTPGSPGSPGILANPENPESRGSLGTPVSHGM